MILKFSFSQVYDNGVLHTILHKIICKTKVNAVISAFAKEVFLYVKGDKKELESFSNSLSNLLPISLFYSFVKVQVVEDMPSKEDFKRCNLPLPFCHVDLQEFLNHPKFSHFSLQEVDEKIKLLKQNKIIKISTLDGVKHLGVISKSQTKLLNTCSFVVMPTDLSLVSKMVVASKDELNALVSFEKPMIEFKTNLIYKAKNIFKNDFVWLKMCDSLLLFYICKKLFQSGEEFLFLSDDELECSGTLVFENQSFTKPLRVNILENGFVVLLNSHDYMSHKTLPKFDKKSHERFAVLMYEYDLFKSKNLNFFLSKKYDDEVMMHDKKTGLVELLKINLPSSFKKLIDDLKQDENAYKLLANYEKKFPNLLENISQIALPKDLPNNFYHLFGIAGVMIGYENDVEKSAEKMFHNAKKFSHTKGPRIDVKLQDDNFPTSINVEKFIQSILSFHLAGVEIETLSFGCFESLAYFICDLSDLLKKEHDIQNISLCGEFFGFKRLLEITAKNIQINHKIYINRAFSLQ